MTPATRSLWLLGHPVAHSLSPAMHRAAYAAMGLDLVYLAADLDQQQLPAALAGLGALGGLGANVTVPHKEAVFELLDKLSPEARAIGAVNTVVVTPDGLVGHNTDAGGWLASWDEEVGTSLAGRAAIVVGAGGAARAICWALASRGVAGLTVLNRTPARAQALVDSLGLTARVAGLEQFEQLVGEGMVVVNTTSLGLASQPGSPVVWPAGLSQVVACDLIYNPDPTRFLLEAPGQRLGGLGMLVHQAALSIQLWTGRQAPVGVMRQAALAALACH
ncbi:MAG: shikimate dehydrogenase [Candidatus Eremiobacteraeota bacterium]|nr:shikimate dehydrogenase [Candidatus Eremiobacteraeota bacterium]